MNCKEIVGKDQFEKARDEGFFCHYQMITMVKIAQQKNSSSNAI